MNLSDIEIKLLGKNIPIIVSYNPLIIKHIYEYENQYYEEINGEMRCSEHCSNAVREAK